MNREENQQIWQKVVEIFPEANFLQSPEWGSVQDNLKIQTFILTNITPDETPKNPYYVLAILRDAKRGRYLEIPCGPLLNFNSKKTVSLVFDKIRTLALENHCVFVRIRPQLVKTAKNLQILADLSLKPSPMHLAAEHTVMIDLKKSEDELLADLRRQTRYEVRRAEKLQIEVKKSNSPEIFDEFYQIQQETAVRQNFIPPSRELLQSERNGFGDNAQIYVACADQKPVAYGLILSSGREADYYEAASTELNRKLPGAYALLWTTIKDLKSQGYERFNLWGIAPPNSPNHRYAGVTTFKTGFGGEVVEYVPAHDFVLNKFKYLKNWIIETVRKKRRHL